MPDVMADRRDAPRYALILVAEITEVSSGTRTIARTADVSRSGCYVDTLNPSSVNTQIRLRLTHGGENFESEGRVVYMSPGLGMGIRFLEYVTNSQLAVLERWLANAGKHA
ncbi:MAG TPA: PilZ domain-containing protein [Candidatus Acidoferrum sp.]|nr:PilZ domain-containing protein [Candidatus Acidoferrum sp.]